MGADHHRRRLIAAAIAGGLVAAAMAEEPIQFKGVPLGASRMEFNNAFTDFRCEPRICTFSRALHCRMANGRLPDVKCEERNTYGLAPIQTAIAAFGELGQLERIALYLDERDVPAVIEALKARHGEPQPYEDPLVPAAQTVEWRRGGNVLTIANRTPAGHGGLVMIESLAGREARHRLVREKKGAASKDL